MVETSDRNGNSASAPPPERDQSSRAVRGVGALVLAVGVVLVALIVAGVLYAGGQPNDDVMQRCLMAGGSGHCGGNTMGGPALLIVVVGFGAAGWIWRKR